MAGQTVRVCSSPISCGATSTAPTTQHWVTA